MTQDALSVIESGMAEIGLNYAFMEWKGDPVYPYFTGEYIDTDSLTEDGLQESSFIFTGFTRGEFLELIAAQESIEKYFVDSKTVITDKGSAVAVFYSGSLVVPTGDAELKKIQINMTVKEWKVL